jgi:hypothetical protein
MRLLALLFCLGAGCARTTFTCAHDDQCRLDGVIGRCMLGGCAFPASDCSSGYRYHESANRDPGECALDGVDASAAPADMAATADIAELPDLTAFDLSTCGAPGLPCCAGVCPGYACAGAICQTANIWAVGFNSGRAAFQHFDGNAWKPILVTPVSTAVFGLASIWGVGSSSAWAVGATYSASGEQNGPALYRYDGASWTACATGASCSPPGGQGLNAVFGLGEDDVWIVGKEQALHWDGATWKSRAMGFTGTAAGVWCAKPNDCWIVTGTQMFRWNGTAWASFKVGEEYAGAVWGFSPSDVWAGTGPGFSGPATLVHWDGSAWSQPYPVEGSPNNAGVIRGLWGVAPSDIWAVGDNGTALHFDGAKWSKVATGTGASLRGVWGVAAKDVWIAGEATLLHWDGLKWMPSTGTTAGITFGGFWGPK